MTALSKHAEHHVIYFVSRWNEFSRQQTSVVITLIQFPSDGQTAAMFVARLLRPAFELGNWLSELKRRGKKEQVTEKQHRKYFISQRKEEEWGKKVHRLLSGHKLVYLKENCVKSLLSIKNVQALGKLFLVINVVWNYLEKANYDERLLPRCYLPSNANPISVSTGAWVLFYSHPRLCY